MIAGGWISDRRRRRIELEDRDQNLRAALTGLYAVRNHVAGILNRFEADPSPVHLAGLPSALAYLNRITDRVPLQSESLAIAVVELGLKIETVIETAKQEPRLREVDTMRCFLEVLVMQANELIGSLEQLDIIIHSTLHVVTDADLARWGINAENNGSGTSED